MSFHFSLDSVLRIRGIVEEQEERMLQRILFEIAQTLEGIESINAELAGSNASRQAGRRIQYPRGLRANDDAQGKKERA